MFIANARVSVLRGTYQDDMDDTHDSNEAVGVDIPASLIEQSQTVTSPETGRSVVVVFTEGFVRPRVDVQKGDRLLDQARQIVYTVDAVTQSSLFGAADKRLKLRVLGA